LQEDAPRRRASAPLEEMLDDTARVRATIDVIADEHDGVLGAGGNGVEEPLQLVDTAVDVADREDAPRITIGADLTAAHVGLAARAARRARSGRRGPGPRRSTDRPNPTVRPRE